MGIRTDIDGHVVTNTPEPGVTSEEIFLYAAAHIEDWEFKQVVWDLSHFDFMSVDARTLRLFVERAAKMSTKRKGRKTALVVQSEVGFGMMRMLQILAEDKVQVTFGVFRDLAGALRWVNE